MTILSKTKTFLNYINGNWLAGSSDETLASINPANREVVGYVQNSTREDLNEAVQAAN